MHITGEIELTTIIVSGWH